MAITPRAMSAQDLKGGLHRSIFTLVEPKTFAESAAAAKNLPFLTPVAYNTTLNQWVVWANGGANGAGTIKGFVAAPEGVDILVNGGGGQVVGAVVIRGEIHYLDVALPTGETAANLRAALRTGALRALGIDVKGLDNVF